MPGRPPLSPMDRPRTPEVRPGAGQPLVRLTHDRRVLAMALLAGAPGVAVALALVVLGDYSGRVAWSIGVALVLVWLAAAFALRARVMRPLQTLTSILAALREGDFSIRARIPEEHASDPLSLTYAELNALEEVMREQRLGAVEATELLRKVLEEVDLAIFAFDEDLRLRLVNRAGARLLRSPEGRPPTPRRPRRRPPADRYADRYADPPLTATPTAGLAPPRAGPPAGRAPPRPRGRPGAGWRPSRPG